MPGSSSNSGATPRHGPEGYPQSFVDRSSDVWIAAESLRLSVNPHLIA